jgi:ATP-binding cassette subfamily C protein LapB
MNQTPQAPLTPEVLGLLLGRLDMGVPSGPLTEACESTRDTDLNTIDQLGRILQAVDRRHARAAMMSWDHFDRRQLPALVLYSEAWHLLDMGDDNTLCLTNEAGENEHIDADRLQGAPLLWLQAKTRRADSTFINLQSSSMRLLLHHMFLRRQWLVDVTIATVVINVLAVATSLFAMHVYDRVIPSFAYATLTTLVVGMVIVMALDWVLKTTRIGILDRVSKAVDQRVSQSLFDHMLNLRQDKRPNGIGTLAAQVNALEGARSFFSSAIIFTLTDLPFALFFIGIIAIVGGKVSLVYLLLMPLALTVGLLSQHRLRRLSRREQQRAQERHGLLIDSIRGSETLASSGAAWRFSEDWKQMTGDIASYSMKSRLIAGITQTTAATLGTLAYVSAIVVGVTQIEAGNITMGALIACTILGGRVIQPIAQSVQLLMQWQHAREGLDMVDQLLETTPARTPDQSVLAPATLDNQIELRDVQFAYPDAPVLRLNLPTLQFNPGDRVVVAGLNGCGKSTLLKVLAGLYKPGQGSIRIGSVDLWELDPMIVNERIGYLPQDVHLFRGTLKSNMQLAGGINDEHLVNTAQQLGIDRIAADNPRSMGLPISEGGQGLSGGQKQLTGLSRLFLSRPRIWLLDEPTANLDDEAEQRVIKQLGETLRHDDILIMTTHRTRLFSLANRMLVMKAGRVVADDKPGDIMNRLQRQRKAQQNPQNEEA